MKAQPFTKIRSNLFRVTALDRTPLVVFEMANNHMGDVNHGRAIIHACYEVAKSYPFHFAFKFQLRHIPTFIHADYQKRKDIPYVKRFQETKITKPELSMLRQEAAKAGFITMCTPFDERSVDTVVDLEFDILKVASASSSDWPLLERIAKTELPIIVSTGGASLEGIDRVVSFLKHREKQFAIMHCVGEYPTASDHLQLNQITLLQSRYGDVVVGFSTHENPNDTLPVQMAFAKGARIFEKHVGLTTEKYALNAYSANPAQLKLWLDALMTAHDMCGVVGRRSPENKKEQEDITKFSRGVFAARKLPKGEVFTAADAYFAFPNAPGQLLARDMSKYFTYEAKKTIPKNAPIFASHVSGSNEREQIYSIMAQLRGLISKSNVPMPPSVEVEISHHYGLERFHEYGATLINVINRSYCKKLIVMLRGQVHPVQYHNKKEETFHVLYGRFTVFLDGKRLECKAGDIITIERGVKHSMTTTTGGIFEEVSSTHFTDDSFYEDTSISKNKHRKTYLSYWLD